MGLSGMMKRLLSRLELLAKLHKPQQVVALAAALRVCGDDEVEAVAGATLKLATAGQGTLADRKIAQEALLELAVNWVRLSPQTRDEVLQAGRGHWARRIGTVPTLEERFASANEPRVLVSLTTMAGEAGVPELGMQVARLLADRRFGAIAEQSLVALAGLTTGLQRAELGALIREGHDDSQQVLRLPEAVAINRAQRITLESSLVQASKKFDLHRRRGVLLAMAIMVDSEALGVAKRGSPGPVLQWLAGNDEPAHMAFRSVIRRSHAPIIRRRAWEWLSHPTLAKLGLERIAHAYSPRDHEVILSRSHMLAHPARAGAVRVVSVRPRSIPTARSEEPPRPLTRIQPGDLPADSPLPDAATAARLSVPSRRGLAKWISALHMEPRLRFDSLMEFLADSDSMVRYAASRELGPMGCGDFCFDSDPNVARSNALSVFCAASGRPVRLDRIVGNGQRFVNGLTRSPHGSVRRIAEEEASRLDPWNVQSPRSRLTARRELMADRGAFIGRLRQRLADGHGEVRLHAVLLARHLGLVNEIELELLAMAGADGFEAGVDLLGMSAQEASGQDRLRLAATAVGALGDASSTAAFVAARGCLGHADVRVRANAVESVLRLTKTTADTVNETGLYTTFIELKDDGSHRVRANAIRGLLCASHMRSLLGGPGNDFADQDVPGESSYEPVGVDALASMLGDERPMHRVAALWLAQRTLAGPGRSRVGRRWTELAARVSDMSACDDDAQVRRRAQRCNRRLMAEIRSGWRDRMTTQTEGAA